MNFTNTFLNYMYSPDRPSEDEKSIYAVQIMVCFMYVIFAVYGMIWMRRVGDQHFLNERHQALELNDYNTATKFRTAKEEWDMEFPESDTVPTLDTNVENVQSIQENAVKPQPSRKFGKLSFVRRRLRI